MRDQQAVIAEESKDGEDLLVVAKNAPKDPFQDPSQTSYTMIVSLKGLHLSFIKQGTELFTFNLIQLNCSTVLTDDEYVVELVINRI